MLDIASSIPACTSRGGASCAFILPTLRCLQPLLFEATKYPSLPILGWR